jgi:hypothetical protein
VLHTIERTHQQIAIAITGLATLAPEGAAPASTFTAALLTSEQVDKVLRKHSRVPIAFEAETPVGLWPDALDFARRYAPMILAVIVGAAGGVSVAAFRKWTMALTLILGCLSFWGGLKHAAIERRRKTRKAASEALYTAVEAQLKEFARRWPKAVEKVLQANEATIRTYLSASPQ